MGSNLVIYTGFIICYKRYVHIFIHLPIWSTVYIVAYINFRLFTFCELLLVLLYNGKTAVFQYRPFK